MSDEKTPQQAIRERVWKKLTHGIDPEADDCGVIDDIMDNTRYAIDVAVHETAAQIFTELWGASLIDCHSEALVRKYRELKKKWVVPVPVPKDDCGCEQCGAGSVVRGGGSAIIPEVAIIPEEAWETPMGKKALKEADEIGRSIKEHQKRKRGKNE